MTLHQTKLQDLLTILLIAPSVGRRNRMNPFEITIINLLLLVANIVVFGLTLKLYTEVLKDKNQDKRIKP
jgi:hypothetical protein